jgi:DNA transformation protein
MAVSDGFRDYLLEQLAGAGPVTPRRMFGGVGLYARGVFFGVLDNDRAYFRVDDVTRPRYEALGSGPFAPMRGEAPMRGYYEVPAAVLDDRDALVEWARESIGVAMSLKTAPKRARTAAKQPALAKTRVLRAGADQRIAAILRPYTPRIRALAGRLRVLVRDVLPTAEERAMVGWKGIGYRDPQAGYVCGVFPQEDHVRLLFEHGAALDDADRLLTGTTKQTRYIEVRSVRDIRVRAIGRLLRSAILHGSVRVRR